MSGFGHDLRYALRLLLKTPAVTVVAVLSLALGIGANTAIFGVINALMLRSLPVHDPQQLVSIGAIDPAHPDQGETVSLAIFNEIRQHASVFSNVFLWSGGGVSNFEAVGVRYAGSLDEVSGDYFAALGVGPILGRVLTHDDAPLDGRPSAQVAVIAYGCWKYRFGGDPNVIGKTIRVDGVPLTIVGVSPANFTGLQIDSGPEATVPIGFKRRTIKYRENLGSLAFGRLKSGFSISQARAQTRTLWPAILRSTVPESFRGAQRSQFFALRPDIQPVARGIAFLRHRLEKPLQILMALVGAVLLIACVNLANLLLARAAARQREFGIRVALGAGRWPLIRIILIEALLLSCTGAMLGLLMAPWTARYLLASFWTGYVPLSLDPSPDARVLAFTTALAIFTGILFGIVPAWRMSRSDPAKALSQSARTTGGRIGRFSNVLVVAQIAGSLVLLLGATLFVRSLRNLQTVDLGYRRDHLLIMQLFPQPGRERIPNRTQYYHELVTRMSQVPGVASVSYLHMGPTSDYEYKVPVSIGAGGALANAIEEWAGPGLFHTMGMHVLAGREFNWHDDEHAPRVAIISESLAQALFPNENPIGRSINVGTEPEHQELKIIGVVNSASLWRFDSHKPLAVYYALMQESRYNESRLLIRTLRDPIAMKHGAEHTLESLGHHYSLRTETLEQRTAEALVLQRMIAMLASGFGLLALLLAAVGLYGVMSYTVTRRTAEIGVRMALGALRGDVLRMVLGEVVRVVLIGTAIALPVAFFCSRLVTGMVFGVSVTDPGTIIVSSLILLAVAAVAGFLPARRASRVDPMVALRCE
jgi:predicted permease